MHIIDERVFKLMQFHVFDRDMDPRAVLQHSEDAAAFVSVLGEGACVTDPNGTLLWNEGNEAFPAGESYDEAADLMLARLAGGKR